MAVQWGHPRAVLLADRLAEPKAGHLDILLAVSKAGKMEPTRAEQRADSTELTTGVRWAARMAEPTAASLEQRSAV